MKRNTDILSRTLPILLACLAGAGCPAPGSPPGANPPAGGGGRTGAGTGGTGMTDAAAPGPGSGMPSWGRGGAAGGGTGGATGTGGGAGAAVPPGTNGGSGPGGAGGAPSTPPAAGEPSVKLFESPCLGVPDPDVAASPTLVGTAIQWNAYFFKKDGTLDHKYKWGALRGSLVSDTHIVYDTPTKRWFMTTIVSLSGGRFGVQFMVSTDENATDWKLSVPIEMPRLIDNPQPTVTSDKVVITESGKCVWAVDKMALIAGNAPLVKELTCAIAQNNQVAAVKFGPEPPETGYAIVMANQTTVNWLSVEGPASAAKVTEHKITVPRVDEVPLAGITQANQANLESGQVKAMWHKGHITWTKTFRCNGVSCIRHFDIDTATNTLTSTDFAVPGTQLFYGGSGWDQAGNAWILMASTKKDGFVGLSLAGRSAGGQLLQPKEIVKGLAAIPGGGGLTRFGDYFSSAMDPADGSTWLIGQYAGMGRGAMNPENSTGCKVVNVKAN